MTDVIEPSDDNTLADEALDRPQPLDYGVSATGGTSLTKQPDV